MGLFTKIQKFLKRKNNSKDASDRTASDRTDNNDSLDRLYEAAQNKNSQTVANELNNAVGDDRIDDKLISLAKSKANFNKKLKTERDEASLTEQVQNKEDKNSRFDISELYASDSTKTLLTDNKGVKGGASILSKEAIDAIEITFDFVKESSRKGARDAISFQGKTVNDSQLNDIDKAWGDATKNGAEILIDKAQKNPKLAEQLNNIVDANGDNSSKIKEGLLKNGYFKESLTEAISQDERFESKEFKELFNQDKTQKFTNKIVKNVPNIKKPVAEKASPSIGYEGYSDKQKELMRQVTYNGPGAQDFETRANAVSDLEIDPRFKMNNGQTPREFAISSGDNKMALFLQVIEDEYAKSEKDSKWSQKDGIANRKDKDGFSGGRLSI